jgi:uncharacterized protein (TIGR03435 family)
VPKFGAHVDGVQVEYDFMSLKDLIMAAYNVRAYQVSGPDWLGDKRFNIVARMPEGASPSDAPGMLQALLQDRFKLVVHRETKERPVLALEVAKGGSRLSPAASQPSSGTAAAVGPYGMIDTPYGSVCIVVNGHEGSTLEFGKTSMDGLAVMLTFLLHGGYDNLLAVQNVTEDEDDWQVVVDRTGLQGDYQVAVNSSLVGSTARERILLGFGDGYTITTHDVLGPAGVIGERDPMVYASLQRLGLKLEKSPGKVEMLMVGHAEKAPSPN